MRKRRYPGGGLNEAVQTLRMLISSAAASQKVLPASTASQTPTPPALPEGMEILNSLDSLSSLSETDLGKLSQEITEARTNAEKQLETWEDMGKQLKSALDAALLIITLKSEPSMPKRRRTAFPSEEVAAEESSGGSEDSEGSEEELDAGGGANASANAATANTDAPNANANANANANVAANAASAPSNSLGSTPSTPAASTGGKDSEKSLLALGIGRQVAFKLPRSAVDEWIQCEITKVIIPGLRFEVRDPEPDERGNPGKTYQCRLKDIMPLPLPDQPVKPLAPGSVVFARYPETTAFYKARVSSYSPKRRSYYLRFEGEEDAHKEIEVNDTFVLSTARARR